MKRWRGITGGLLLILLVLPTSCRREEVPASAPGKAETEAPSAERIVAVVDGDRLRVRSLPYLDGDIVAYLMTGDIVAVESRTEWSQDIGERNAPWYFVRTDTDSGWTYGGFLRFDGTDAGIVPVNPALPPPAPAADDTPEGPLDPGDLPEILIPVFGMAGVPPSLTGRSGTITYEAEREDLVIPFRTGGDSPLAMLGRAGTDRRLKLVAESSAGTRYENTYAADNLRRASDVWDGVPDSAGNDAWLIPFYRLATLDGGAWEFYAFVGDEGWPAAVGRADIPPGEVSLVPSERPDPTADSPRSVYTAGDTIYAFGRIERKSDTLQVALYHDPGESREGMVVLEPVRARQVAVDDSGQWSAVFTVGAEFPQGRCWAAVGNPIEGPENLRLFVTSVEIR